MNPSPPSVCDEHQDMAISCSKIGEIYADVKAMRGELSTVLKTNAVLEEKIKTQRYLTGIVITGEIGLLFAIAAEWMIRIGGT